MPFALYGVISGENFLCKINVDKHWPRVYFTIAAIYSVEKSLLRLFSTLIHCCIPHTPLSFYYFPMTKTLPFVSIDNHHPCKFTASKKTKMYKFEAIFPEYVFSHILGENCG